MLVYHQKYKKNNGQANGQSTLWTKWSDFFENKKEGHNNKRYS